MMGILKNNLIYFVCFFFKSECYTNQKDAIILAIKWTEYLSLHAKKIYRVHDYPFHNSVQAFKAKLAAKKINDGDTIRSISRHCWEYLTTSEQVENAVSFLCQRNWIKVKEVNTGFRPTRIIKINPSFFTCL